MYFPFLSLNLYSKGSDILAPGDKDCIVKSEMSIILNKYDVSNNNKSKVCFLETLS